MARKKTVPAVAGLGVSIIAVATAMGAGLGTRLGWWHFRDGFGILKWAACLGIGGAALSLLGAIFARPGSGRRGLAVACAGIVLGAAAFGVPWSWSRIAKKGPMIHDISTDTENPPAFVAILPLRKDAPSSAEHGGPEIAARQRAAYPDIRPIDVGIPPARAYDYAFHAARAMGWRIADADRKEGRIEATATTRWFGFEDDVVIRIVPMAARGSRLDIRSVSRVGISDLGTNARRIRAFRTKFLDMSKTAMSANVPDPLPATGGGRAAPPLAGARRAGIPA
jgi:uncharacterized protein (DUF1499 family)